jgi:hypothetical protein
MGLISCEYCSKVAERVTDVGSNGDMLNLDGTLTEVGKLYLET